jgi:shikimate dehydrogenase
MISGKARIAGVIGWPVSHSLSPRLHNYWLNTYGIDGAYIPLPVLPEELQEVFPALVKMGFRGVNLTLPHKELVLPLLDSISEEARMIGAVNTVTVTREGKLAGSNTDAFGFMENIRLSLPQTRHKAVVLGAGGAAKAVYFALGKLQFRQIVVLNRTADKAAQMAAQFPHVSALPWDNRAQALEGADLLVNATSLGMAGKEPLPIDLASLPPQALVTDIVYTPLLTPLLVEAAKRGNPIVDGLGMLLHQAAPGFEAWFGRRPDVTPELKQFMLDG